MSSENLEQWGKFSRAALDSLKELTSINLKLAERLAEQQFELVSASIDATLKGAQLAAAPAYREVVAGQTALAGEYNERVLGIVRKTTGIAAEVRDEYSEWVEGRLKDIATPIHRPAAAKKSA